MLAIIGGRGLSYLPELNIERRAVSRTPHGSPSCPLIYGHLAQKSTVFLARHGHGHSIAPHEINYRANIWALKEQCVSGIISIGTVVSLHKDIPLGTLVVPEDIIDYTNGRVQTYFEGAGQPVVHTDFSEPYDINLRQKILLAAKKINLNLHDSAVYACIQGPRLSTASEAARIKRDGADVIGMSGMPEAILARELKIPYVHLCGVSGWAAGHDPDGIKNRPNAFTPETATASLGQVRNVLMAFCEGEA